MKRLAVLVAIAALLASVTIHAKKPKRLVIEDQAAWDCARILVMGPFEIAGHFEGEYDPSFYLAMFRNRLASGLRRAGIEVLYGKEGDGVRGPGVLVLDGEFLELSTGSRAKRFWIGFGAGRSKCKVTMRATDSASGSRVFSVTHARLSAEGLKHDELQENITEVVDDIVRALIARRHQCESPPTGQAVTDQAQVRTEAHAPGIQQERSPRLAGILIESSPENAEVYANGRFIGTTPVRIEKPVGSRVKIRIEKFGRETWERTLSVEREDIHLKIDLVQVRTKIQRLS